MARIEVQVVNAPVEVVRNVEPSLNESFLNEELRRDIRELPLAPPFDAFDHGLEVPLHVVDAARKSPRELKILRVLGEQRLKIASEGHVVADEDPVANGERKLHRFVMGVADAKHTKNFQLTRALA